MPQPVDIAARQLALDISQSFAVSAPAGSGKTGLLTQRTLALLAHCEQPENILAITFTKKAAAEMQQRILSALETAQHQPEPEEDFLKVTWHLAKQVLKRDQQQQWHLLASPQRLRITTIDSFCRLLSQQCPLNNGLGHTPEVLTETDAFFAYQQAARNTLNQLDQHSSLQPDLQRLTRHLNNQLTRVETLFIQLLQRRDQWLGAIFHARDERNYLESTLKLIITDQLQRAHTHLLPFAGELLTIAQYAGSQLQRTGADSAISLCADMTELPKPKIEELTQWRALAALLLTNSGTPRQRLTKNEGFPTADKTLSKEEVLLAKQMKNNLSALLNELATSPIIIDDLAAIPNLPESHYSESQWQLLNSLTQILPTLVAQCRLVFQQLGKVDFIEITQSALQALGDEQQPTDLALALDYRIQHILVDEFQDTSTPQRQLLLQLTAGWQTGDGRTLFVVGDAMQSCYGFRDANVGIFLDIRQQGLGHLQLTPLDLTVNFRSQQGIVDWCNSTFSALFPPQDNSNLGAVRYQYANPAKEKSVNPAVITEILISPENNPQRIAEAKKIVDIIQGIRQQHPNNSIAILVRKRSQVTDIAQALNAAEITYRATEIEKLDTQIIISDLLSLTRALLYPNDRIAWLALLRAPWCGLTMNDLYQVATHQINERLPSIFTTISEYQSQLNLSPDGKYRLVKFFASIKDAIAQQGRKNLRLWVEGTWVALGGSALLINTAEQHAVDTFWKTLEKFEVGCSIRHWHAFSDAVKKLYMSAPTEQTATSTVDIMTIHKSKGLEFDSVIIPGLDLSSASDKQELLLWNEWLDNSQQTKLVISPVHATGDDRDVIYDYIRKQKNKKQLLESDRLFYVGCTRAIQQLFLLGQVIDNKNPPEPPKNNSLLSRVWPLLENDLKFTVITEKDLIDNRHPNKIIRLGKNIQAPEIINHSLLTPYLNISFADDHNNNRVDLEPLKQRQSRYFGIVLHRALQQITETGYQLWDHNKLQEQQHFWQLEFESLGLDTHQAKLQTKIIVDRLKKLINGKHGSWLLDNTHPESQCEYLLHLKQRAFVIDRTFIDKNTNERWIIDYKSSQPQEEQLLDEFLEKEAEKYTQQLTAYARLFQKSHNPLRMALYFPLIDTLHCLQ